LESATGAAGGFSRDHPGHFGGPIRFSPDNRTFLVTANSALSQRDLRTGKEIRRFSGEHFAGWSNDGKLLALQRRQETGPTLRVVDAGTSEERWALQAEAQKVMFSSDGTTLTFVEGDTVRVVRADSGRLVRKFRVSAAAGPGNNQAGPTGHLLEVSPDLGWVAVASPNHDALQIWDMTTGKNIWNKRVPFDGRNVWSAHFLSGGAGLVLDLRSSPDNGENLIVLDPATGARLRGFKGQGWPLVAVSPDGRFLAFHGKQGVEVAEAHTGRSSPALDRQAERGYRIVFSSDGSFLVHNPDEYTFELREVITGDILARCSCPWHQIKDIAIAPDSRTLTVARNDSTMLLWDVTGLATEAGRLPRLALTPAELGRLWDDLGDENARRRYRALWTLAAGGERTVAELRRRVRAVERLDAKHIANLVADLDSDSYEKRERATRQLEALEGARPALAEVLAGRPGPEVRRRLQDIVGRWEEPALNLAVLRQIRAVQVLEQIASPEAERLLRDLAGGLPEARLTQEARAALQRRHGIANVGVSRGDHSGAMAPSR
jgi:WD40 repeat protein